MSMRMVSHRGKAEAYIWLDLDSFRKVISQDENGNLWWHEHPGKICINLKGPKFVNHCIRMIGGLIEQKRLDFDQDHCEDLLNKLYLILESKL